MFELPGVDLSDIEIPLIEVPGGRLPSRKELARMMEAASRCLDNLDGSGDPRKVREIQKQLSAFSVDPSEWELGNGAPSLMGDGCGTHFFIQPADPIIQEDIDNRQSDGKATRFERNLIGLTAAVTEFSDEALRSVKTLRTDIGALSAQIASKVRETTRDSYHAVNHTVDEVIAELDKLQRSSTRTKDLSAVREELSSRINEVQSTENAKLERLRDQLNEVNRVWTEGSYDTTELTVAIEEELEELRDRRDADLELAQIGLALNTVSHEFEKNVGSIRDGINRLGAWAAENPELGELHQELRVSFDHLDEYLSLFTQLDRRANSSAMEISGKHIFEFCEKLFAPRMQRHDISLVATTAFRKAVLSSYPSAIYPVFVNLIDNAIFWLQRNRGDRKITLDSDGNGLLVRDNGPGISIRDRENVFALNFSRKPGGRGMGLHISRQTLARVGFAVELDQRGDGEGAIFRITAAKEAAPKAGRKRK